MSSYAEGFENWAEHYETGDEIQELVKHANFSESRVLEIGCGAGRLTKRLAPRSDEYYAIDINSELVHYVNKDDYVKEDAEAVLTADGQNLPFADNSIDILIDGWTLTSQNQDKALPEYQRVVKNDGVILLLTESWDEYDREMNSEYVRMMRKYDPDYDWYDLEQEVYEPLYKYFSSSQLTKIQIETEYRFPSTISAYRAFEFHITQHRDKTFPEDRREKLWNHLSTMAVGENGPIQFTEHANLFVIEPSVSPKKETNSS